MKKEGIAIVPFYKDKIVIIGQERGDYEKLCWNVVMGGIKEGENTLEIAKRELEEEINVNDAEFEKLGSFIQMPGVVDIKTTIYKAILSQEPSLTVGNSEKIRDLELVNFQEVVGYIKKGKIWESMSSLAILLALDNHPSKTDVV